MCYAYDSEIYCDDCAEEIKRECGEDTGDTNEYPQHSHNDESDCPQHCAGCGEFLENALTTDGYDYVRSAMTQALRGGHDDAIALTIWGPYYDIPIDTEMAGDAGFIECAVHGHHGVYVPQAFLQNYDYTQWSGINEEDARIVLNGPDEEFYWEAWEAIVDNAFWIDPDTGEKWALYQDGDLFVYRADVDIEWE